MKFNVDPSATKPEVFAAVKEQLFRLNLGISSMDDNRPWGGFFVINEEEAESFIKLFFPHLTREDISISGKLSPKILAVAPGKRLSWQYHYRRAEIWKLVGGEARIMTSDDDEETDVDTLYLGDVVQLSQGKRHRLIGSDNNWGVVAEIWQHTDSNDPSDEDDIIRLQDDFGRKIH